MPRSDSVVWPQVHVQHLALAGRARSMYSYSTEMWLTTGNSMRFLARPENYECGLSSFCKTGSSRFPSAHREYFEIWNFAFILFWSPSKDQSNSHPSHCDILFFTHPPLAGLGICQNFGSLKTLQFQPPTQLNTCRIKLHFVANWISTLKYLLRLVLVQFAPSSLPGADIASMCRNQGAMCFSVDQKEKSEKWRTFNNPDSGFNKGYENALGTK